MHRAPPKPLMIAQVLQPIQVFTFRRRWGSGVCLTDYPPQIQQFSTPVFLNQFIGRKDSSRTGSDNNYIIHHNCHLCFRKTERIKKARIHGKNTSLYSRRGIPRGVFMRKPCVRLSSLFHYIERTKYLSRNREKKKMRKKM